MRLRSKSATASSGYPPAVLAKAISAASLLWLGLTACSYDGATSSAAPAAWTGHDRQHSGRDRSDRSAARRDAIRSVAVPRIPGLPKRSPIRPPLFHWPVLQDAVASRMQGRSNKGLPRAHEVLRDSALAWSGSPAVTSTGSLTRGLGWLVCWLGMTAVGSALWPLADPASLAACTQRCQAAYDAETESCIDSEAGAKAEQCMADAKAAYVECMARGCGMCVVPLPGGGGRELTVDSGATEMTSVAKAP